MLVTKLEVIWNGQVAAQHGLNAASADVTGRITPKRGGWMLVRAWREEGDEDVLDIHRYATTSPVYVTMGGRPRPSRAAATWVLEWLDRLEKATLGNPDYRTPGEREAVLRDASRARAFYQSCSDGDEESGENARRRRSRWSSSASMIRESPSSSRSTSGSEHRDPYTTAGTFEATTPQPGPFP